jgi:two-component system response regulator FixJ
MNKDSATVHIVDDDDDTRAAIADVVSTAGLTPCLYASAKAFLDKFRDDGPACILVDLRMPEMNGLQLMAKIGERNLKTPVIVITGYADVPSAVQVMKLGAFDLLEKPWSGDELVARLRAAIDLDRDRRLVLQDNRLTEQRIETLSPRERQVLEMIVSGKASREIAADLGLSVHTVDNHRAHIMKKMKTESLASLVRITTEYLARTGIRLTS